MIRQRQESARAYEEGGRLDLADAGARGDRDHPRLPAAADDRRPRSTKAVAAAIEETGASLDPRHGQGDGDAQGAPHRPDGLRPRRRRDQAGVPLGAARREGLAAAAASRGRDRGSARGGDVMKKRLFGRDDGGRAVEEVVLESPDAAVSILSLGCVVRDWRVDGPRRQPADGARLPPARGLPAPFPLARRHRRPRRQPHRRARLHPRRRDLRAHRRTRAPHHLHGGATGPRQAASGRWRPTAPPAR